jgi:YjbR
MNQPAPAVNGVSELTPVAHPRMYSDDDPFLTDLRKVALTFPESAEVEAWGRPTFRAGKKIFAIFEGSDDHPYGVIFKPEPDERLALLEDRRFYSPPYWGPAAGSPSTSQPRRSTGKRSASCSTRPTARSR